MDDNRTRYFLLRFVRGGPLVPARLREIDHEPGEPENKRDRWPPFITIADIAGELVPTEMLTERLHWKKGHWKYLEPVSPAEYRYRFEYMRWAETAPRFTHLPKSQFRKHAPKAFCRSLRAAPQANLRNTSPASRNSGASSSK